MENWECSNCKALNSSRRDQCWQCGISKPGHITAGARGARQVTPRKRTAPNKRKQTSKNSNPVITVAIIGLIGTILAAIVTSPALTALIQGTPMPNDSTSSTSLAITSQPTSTLPTEIPSLTIPELKIEYGGALKSLAYSPGPMPGYFPNGNLVILTARPTAGIGLEELGYLGKITAPRGNIMTMSVTNQSSKTIILNNMIPIEVNHKPSMTLVHAYSPAAVGGEGYYRNFVTKMPVEEGQQVVWAVLEEEGPHFADLDRKTALPPINQPDFFTLAPGEIEVFLIEVQLDAPGDYILRPGVEFLEDGKTVRVWISDYISASMPETMMVWRQDLSTNALVNDGTCHFNYDVNLDELTANPQFQSVYTCDF